MGHNKYRDHIDWNAAFIYYCTAEADHRMRSLHDVAVYFKINEKNVEKVSRRSEWVKRRKQAGERALAAFEDEKVELAKKLNQRQFENLNRLEENILQVMDNMQKARDTYKNATTIEEKLTAAKLLTQEPYDFEKLSNALKNVHNMQRVILGMPTDYTKQKIDTRTATIALTPEQAKEMDDFIQTNGGSTIQQKSPTV